MQQLVVVGAITGTAGKIAPAVLALVDPAGASDTTMAVKDPFDSVFNTNIPELTTIM